jgi:hypothetical protein
MIRRIAFVALAVAGCATAPVPTPRVRATTTIAAPPAPQVRSFPAVEDDEGYLIQGHESGSPPDDPVAPPLDIGGCLRSRMCQLEGFCSPNTEGTCVAANDADCRPSDACLGGRCTARDGHCIAANDADCRESWACKGYGLCRHDGDEACMATSEDDCRASTRCAREGECTLAAGACVRAASR